MGKIITGQELINIFKGCCSGQTQSFTDAAYIEGIQESMGLSNVENSGRCPAFNGNIVTVFYPTTFWNQMYGGDTGYEFYGTDQIDWTSGYLGLEDTQLVDSTYVPSFASQMRCTNLRYTGDFCFGLYTGGEYSGGFTIKVYIYIGSQKVLVAHYYPMLSSGDEDAYLASEDVIDVVFGGSSNIPSNSGTYLYAVEVGWETGSDGTHNITNLSCEVYGDSGLMSGSITGYGASEGTGGSFAFMGQGTFADIISINTVYINGEWENGGGSSGGDAYTTLRITNCYLRTNATSVIYVSGATSASTIDNPYSTLYSTNLSSTSVQVYLIDEDLANGEIGVQLPAQYVGSYSGSYLLPLKLICNGYRYTLYVPVSVTSAGNVNLRSSECYLDLSSVSYNNNAITYRQVYNYRTTQVTFRPLTSSGVPSKTLSSNTNAQTTPLLSTIHVYPQTGTMGVRVGYGTSTTSTATVSSTTVATQVANTTVNLIPSYYISYGLYGLLQRIGKAVGQFTVYFE